MGFLIGRFRRFLNGFLWYLYLFFGIVQWFLMVFYGFSCSFRRFLMVLHGISTGWDRKATKGGNGGTKTASNQRTAKSSMLNDFLLNAF